MKKNWEYVVLGVVFVLVTMAAIWTQQPLYRYLPLCVSMVIYLLQAHVSRYAYLLGSLNSLLYTVVYVSLKVYGSAASAFFISFPMQMITFFMWRRRADGHSTILRQMKWRGRLLTLVLFSVAWTTLYLILNALGSASVVLDNTTTLLGVLVYILTMFSFIEYTYLQIVVNVFGILLQISLMKDNPGQITYLIMTLYSTVFAVRAIFRARALYKKQQEERKHENSGIEDHCNTISL